MCRNPPPRCSLNLRGSHSGGLAHVDCRTDFSVSTIRIARGAFKHCYSTHGWTAGKRAAEPASPPISYEKGSKLHIF